MCVCVLYNCPSTNLGFGQVLAQFVLLQNGHGSLDGCCDLIGWSDVLGPTDVEMDRMVII